MARKLLALALIASVLSAAGPLAAPPPANAAVDLRLCGTVGVYVAPTKLLPGAVTISGVPLVILPGTPVPASLKVGANICIAVDLNRLNQIVDIDVVANATATVRACGVVTALVKATASAAGSVTVGGRTFVLAAGSKLPATVAVGADLCLELTLNGFAQVNDARVLANVVTALSVCGYVAAYAAAGVTTNGSLTIAGVARTVAPGTTAAASLAAGVYANLRLEIDVFGRISDVSVLAVGASLRSACGAGPEPTPKPTPKPSSDPSPDPSGSADPSATPNESHEPGWTPGASDEPNGSPNASGTPAPSGTPGPSATVAAGATHEPGSSGDPSGDPGDGTHADSCVAEGTASSGAAASRVTASSSSESFLPDTASIARAGGVVLTVGLPFILLVAAFVTIAIAARKREEVRA